MVKTASTSGKKKMRKMVSNGIIHISATFNNTIITVTDGMGNTLIQSSSGAVFGKGSRKSTPFAAQEAARALALKIRDPKEGFGMQMVEIRVKGPGSGRESALRALAGAGLRVSRIVDVTRLPHNGVRPRKKRRA